MQWLDWIIVVGYLSWVIYDGLKRTKASTEIEGYFLANRSLPWWAVGLSVMATQLSAITMVGTTGQGFTDGMRFIQFYYGLPVAMIILSLTVVPFFHRAKVFTAYEYLERRFDVRVRTLTSFLFLMSRGMSCGVIIAAPSVILSIVLGWNLTFTVLAIGMPTAAYTMFGGVQAVTWTDVKQMFLIVFGLCAVTVALVLGLPEGVGFGDALQIAGVTNRLDAFDFRFDLNETYTFWSGMIGGLFLMLSYFGCDQSQVQRYLTAKSIDQARSSLMMSAFWKIPLQALVLLVGILVFAFYLFSQPPMLFNPVHEQRVRTSAQAEAYASLEGEYAQAFEARKAAAESLVRARKAGDHEGKVAASAELSRRSTDVNTIRLQASELVQSVSGDRRYRDVNYIFPTYVTTQLPIGLVGLLIAAIFAAAMSSISSELNSLSTATVIDFYRRHFNKHATDAHYLLVSKFATGFWGLFACTVAVYASTLGSLIEVVNRFGSFFYGSILGVFVLAILVKRATAAGAFIGLIGGMSTVAWFAMNTSVSFLWHNVIGAAAVVTVGVVVSLFTPDRRTE